MKAIVFGRIADDSRVVRGVRALLSVHGPVKRGSSPDAQLELARVVAMADNSLVLSTLEHFFRAPAAAFPDSAAATVWLAIVAPVFQAEAWQRVRLLGWMLLVSTVTAGWVAGFGDSASRTFLVAIWVSALALAIGLMIGSRRIAAAWHEYKAARR